MRVLIGHCLLVPGTGEWPENRVLYLILREQTSWECSYDKVLEAQIEKNYLIQNVFKLIKYEGNNRSYLA